MPEFTCKECGKKYKREFYYKKHMKEKHGIDVDEEEVEEEEVEEGDVVIKDISNPYNQVKKYYNEVLNKDKKTFKTKNDEPTPIECIEYMISKIPIPIHVP